MKTFKATIDISVTIDGTLYTKKIEYPELTSNEMTPQKYQEVLEKMFHDSFLQLWGSVK